MSAGTQVRDAHRDGRLARSVGTCSAVIDALLALLEGGDLRPTAPRIAERAGVSLRSVFQHFPDMEAVFAAAADRQTERIRPMARPISSDGPLGERLAAFVAQRARVFEAITPVRRAALLMEPFSPEVAKRLRQARAAGRTEVERVFAHELARWDTAGRSEAGDALEVASSFSTWHALRSYQGLPVERARKVMARMVQAVLEVP